MRFLTILPAIAALVVSVNTQTTPCGPDGITVQGFLDNHPCIQPTLEQSPTVQAAVVRGSTLRQMAPKRRSTPSERRKYTPEDKALIISNRGIIESRGWFSSFINSVVKVINTISTVVKIALEVLQIWTDMTSYNWVFAAATVAGEVHITAPSAVIQGDPYASTPDRHYYFTPKTTVVKDPPQYCPPGLHCQVPKE